MYSPFNISGWALDTGGGEGVGTGINKVQVYDGNACSGKLLGETTTFHPRSDVMRNFNLDSSYQNGGFTVQVNGIESGSLTYTVCAYSALSGQPQKSTRTVSVEQAHPQMNNEWPRAGSSVSLPFDISGWALDSGGGEGVGTGINRVQVYAGTACSGNLLGETSTFQARPDVMRYFNLDSSYQNGGFKISITDVSPGSLTYSVCARSSLNGLDQKSTRTVTVLSASPVLKMPANLSQNPHDYELKFEWNPVAGASEYLLEWWGGPYGKMQPCGWSSATSCQVGTVWAGNTYFWHVKARDSQGNSSDWSPTWSFGVLMKPPMMNAEWPRAGSTVYAPFNVTGWALDNGGGEGAGTGIYRVQVYEGTACSGKLLGETSSFHPRSDVMRYFNLDSSYQNSGFAIAVKDVDPGSLTYTVCATSTLSEQAQKSTRTITVGQTQPKMNAEWPRAGSTVYAPFNISGWALDTGGGEGVGTGINKVQVYDGNACSGKLLGETTTFHPRSDVMRYFNLDSSYQNGGFAMAVKDVDPGSLTYTVCAFSTLNGQAQKSTRTVTVGSSLPKMNAEWPRAESTVYTPFDVSGWALDTGGGEGAGMGVDRVQVYAGTACSGNLLGETNTFQARPDVMRYFNLDSSYLNSGFAIAVDGVAPGTLTYTVCAFSALNGQPLKSIRTVTVVGRSQPKMNAEWPRAGSTVDLPFNVSGWALDTGGGEGAGMGIDQVQMYKGNACSGTLLGETTNFHPRSDVMRYFNLDSSYQNSGFSITITGINPGTLTYTVCARSTLNGQFQKSTRTVNIGGATDLAVDRVELIQGITMSDPYEVHVAGRDTLLRAFINLSGVSSQSGVQARLTRYVGGALQDSLISNTTTIQASTNEGNLAHTLNFTLPTSWLSAGTSYVLEIDHQNLITETNETNNRYPSSGAQSFEFVEVDPLEIVIVPVTYARPGITPTNPRTDDLSYLTWMPIEVFPIPIITYELHSPISFTGDLRADGGWGDLLSQIDALHASEDPDNTKIYYGVINSDDADGCTGSCTVGLGYMGWPTAVGFSGWGAGTAEASETMTHEIGHNFDRSHAPCGDPGNPDPNWPAGYLEAIIGQYGYNFGSSSLVAPGSTHDYMSYCEPNWTSDYTYKGIFDYYQTSAFGIASLGLPTEAIYIGGTIDVNNQVHMLPPFAQIAPLSNITGSSYRLEFLNVSGDVLLSQNFAPREIADAPEKTWGFGFFLPAQDGLAIIRMYAGDQLIFEYQTAGGI